MCQHTQKGINNNKHSLINDFIHKICFTILLFATMTKKEPLERGKENIFFSAESYPNCIAVTTISNKQIVIMNAEFPQVSSLEISTPNLIA